MHVLCWPRLRDAYLLINAGPTLNLAWVNGNRQADCIEVDEFQRLYRRVVMQFRSLKLVLLRHYEKMDCPVIDSIIHQPRF